MADINFTTYMRMATRDVHKLSDSLLNAKLAIAISDDTVWADGLLVFYEIFKYLEENVSRDLLPREFHRKRAFENDLSYYLGSEWKQTYEPRKEVRSYVAHLKAIKKKNPILLLAYVYHLYMGLLSGGQILQKKNTFARRMNPLAREEVTFHGSLVTYFGGSSITELKFRLRQLVDTKAMEFDDELKKLMLEESRKVFELNNEIVKTVKGINEVSLRKVLIVALFAVLTYFLYTSLFC